MWKKKTKEEDLFINEGDDWSALDGEDFEGLDQLEGDEDDEIGQVDHESIDDEDEARYQQHLKLKREDKIFNNSWNSGEGVSDEMYHNTGIRLDPGHTDSHLLDGASYDKYMDKVIIERDLNNIAINDEILVKLMDITMVDGRKFTKPEINLAFSRLCDLVRENNKTTFIGPIDVLDFVSMISQMDFKRLFESLEYEYKEVLLLELNNKFGILDGKVRFKKLF
jgi:hypothetical protein